MVTRALLLAAAVALLSCSSERVARTEIMLVVDSDLSVPEELDEIEMVVEGPDGKRKDALAVLEESPLPRSLGLVHTRGALEPLNVQVNGLLAGEVVVSRRASLAFVAGKTLVLPLHLTRSCVDMECGDQTCAEGSCVEVELDARELDPWTGEEPRLEETDDPPPEDAGVELDAGDEEVDAGEPSRDAGRDATADARADGGRDAGAGDGGECVTSVETCNQRDDDCDGEVDEDFSLNDDARNCGSCGNVCGGAARACCEGSCRRSCF